MNRGGWQLKEGCGWVRGRSGQGSLEEGGGRVNLREGGYGENERIVPGKYVVAF